MKVRFVILVFAVITFAACKKTGEYEYQPGHDQRIVAAKNIQGIYISEWKTASSLTSAPKPKLPTMAKRFEIPTATSLQQDVVLVFARNLWEENAELNNLGEDQPLQMPFNFLPYSEQPGYVENWNYVVQDNKVDVVLTVNGNNASTPPVKKVEVQFVVIPSELVAQKMQTKQELMQMSYEEVLKTFDRNS